MCYSEPNTYTGAYYINNSKHLSYTDEIALFIVKKPLERHETAQMDGAKTIDTL